MKHYASPAFWALYNKLPAEVRTLADKNYELLKSDERHPSLHFKRIGPLWSVRVGGHYRALGHDVDDGVQWFWIGTMRTTTSLSANKQLQRTVIPHRWRAASAPFHYALAPRATRRHAAAELRR